LAELRRELFAMVLAKGAQAALAERCLVEIDELYDWHGRIDDEPRHPGIASGEPWPLMPQSAVSLMGARFAWT
jgi:hypothetical protein